MVPIPVPLPETQEALPLASDWRMKPLEAPVVRVILGVVMPMEILAAPMTSNFWVGLVVPIPTLPVLLMVMMFASVPYTLSIARSPSASNPICIKTSFILENAKWFLVAIVSEAMPKISNLAVGAVVPIPTLPAVVMDR
ncbi:MAG: hypothetical protein UT14_C0033G0024 [Candidatus Shapirobacteria bacterium GW2011_GWE1_38_92]|uniref:Uncharacterized protein n=1 Tax=Candidatus Shapirobacteria bacterium GW2011_GWE1_38_92 TaxID=1618489 RepID=A0A0G0NXR7_9BACT|nr:MAG: hypothetical protein UT14_C0033G0024 [Candidatus Shapirobacteria bacterium GW2011_GWE1_38_92]